MKRWHKGLLAMTAVGVALGIAAYALRGDIAVAMMRRTALKALSTDAIAALPDGLHVGLCGSGSPFPDPKRAGPCVAVVAGRRLFVVDAGDGSARTLQLMGWPAARVDAVLLTHFHSDHIDGLGALMLQRWGGGSREEPLPVHGPAGVETIVDGFNRAYRPDGDYRIAHHGQAVIPPAGFGGVAKPFALHPERQEAVVLDGDGLTVTAFMVDHAPVEPAVGYVFAYKGRKLVISGDTVASARVETAAKGADVLVHEALSPELVAVLRDAARDAGRRNLEQILKDIVGYHTTPEQAAGIAARAGVGTLLLHHIVPALPLRALEGPFLGQARKLFAGPVLVGRDGDVVSMPAGGKAVTHSNALR